MPVARTAPARQQLPASNKTQIRLYTFKAEEVYAGEPDTVKFHRKAIEGTFVERPLINDRVCDMAQVMLLRM